MAKGDGGVKGILPDNARVEELPDTDGDVQVESAGAYDPSEDPPFSGENSQHPRPPWLDPIFIDLLDDGLSTKTYESERKTRQECLPYLELDDTHGLPVNSSGLPHLRRDAHINFMTKVFDRMPAPYMAIDASRPWLFYWSLMGLTSLGQDVRQHNERLIQTLRPLQNASGGFGGGSGHISHCATSYGCTLALAMTGGLDVIDRKAMWQWLGQVKQADGGFKMAMMAEEDIRGAYCAMTIITLLNLPLELPPDAPARQVGSTSFLDGLGEWISRCQTYEGGMAAAPHNEAHGAYAFCALACLSIIDAPSRSVTKYLDVKALISCLASLQTRVEGGFAGRTNKLVDACYSHWVGGCWAILEAAVAGASPSETAQLPLWNRQGLIRYLLTCCQQPGKRGGMRDKPSAKPDAYHTCYSLAGLSAAVNHYHFMDGNESRLDTSGRLTAAFGWSATCASWEEKGSWGIDGEDAVGAVHPVFVIPMEAVEQARHQFQKQLEGER